MNIASISGGFAPAAGVQNAKEPKTLGPFLLGLFLGVIGIVITVLVYDDKDGPYTKDPKKHALICSLYGTLIWLILSLFFIPFVLLAILV
jgi:hypothetical protein